METLDNILSGKGEATPAPETKPETETTVAAAETEKPQTQTETEEAVTTTPDGQKMVPLAALHASKEKAKRYTEQVAEFDKSVSGLREQNQNLTRQVTELLQRIPQQQPQQQQAPDWFENPNAAAMHAFGPHLEQVQQVVLANSRMTAETKFGDDKVDGAEKAFIRAMESRTLDPADYHKVVNSPNRYAEAVKWHQRQLAQQEIGDDPAAFRAKVEAEIMAKHGLAPETNGQQVAQRAPVMPTNLATARNVGQRTGPAWSGPPEIADIFNRKRSPA